MTATFEASRTKSVGTNLRGALRALTVEDTATALDAALRMTSADANAVLVTRDGDVAGIITEKDLVQRVLCSGRLPHLTMAHEIMSSPVISADISAPIALCAELMRINDIRHLVVREGIYPVAVVSARDLLDIDHDAQNDLIRDLESYIYAYR